MEEEISIKVARLKRVAGRQSGEAALVAALSDEAIAVRETAVALAARHMSPEALEPLVRQDASVTLCNSAISALERQGPCAVPRLMALTADPDARVAIFAVQILARIREPASAPALVPLLAHADLNVVAGAIEALGNLRAGDAVPALLPFLRGEMWLQFAAIGALGDIGDERATDALLGLIEDDVLATAAVEALGKIGSRAALLPLMQLMIELDRLPMRDTALLAVAAIVERHEPGVGAFSRLRRALVRDTGVHDYFIEALHGPEIEVARAASRVVLAARLRRLVPGVFARARTSNDLAWLAQQAARARLGLRSQVAGLIGHDEAAVRQAALRCCELEASALPMVLARLDDRDEGVREAACWALGRMGAAGAVPRLVELIETGSVTEQHAAAEALRHMPVGALGPLERCLRSDAGTVPQLLGLSVLEATRASGFAAQVLALVASDRAPVRAAALRALAADGSGEAEARLLVALHDDAPAVGVEAIDMLAQRDARVALPHLLRLLDGQGPLRYHAIRAIGRMGADEVVPALIALFARAATHERIEVVVALARIGGAAALPFLRERLRDGETDLRRAAAEGLARHVETKDVVVLEQLALDDDWLVRNCAAWGLGRLATPGAEEALLALARDVETVVARTARTALARLRRPGAGAS